ncbi:hypothetical protein BH23BAC3_BH23BAC3_12760 [soil metagenome]
MFILSQLFISTIFYDYWIGFICNHKTITRGWNFTICVHTCVIFFIHVILYEKISFLDGELITDEKNYVSKPIRYGIFLRIK